MSRLTAVAVIVCALALSVMAANADDALGIDRAGSISKSARQSTNSGEIVAHPAGCPHSLFCGCGTCSYLGIPVSECKRLGLFLARNWKRFPSAAAATGMAAWNNRHVFAIISVNGDGTALAYDPNSGGRRTRIHTVSLRGYRIVNPHVQVAQR